MTDMDEYKIENVEEMNISINEIRDSKVSDSNVGLNITSLNKSIKKGKIENSFLIYKI